MAKKRESYFWTSYSDLMTSLFFIMLTLFILTVVLLNQRMKATEAELSKIKAIQESTKELDKKDGYFEYKEEYEKYSLKIDVFFPEKEKDFKFLSESCKDSLDKAGEEIVNFLKRHADNKYLLIIEGQASRDSEFMMDYNYLLSFERAKNLVKFWQVEKQKSFGDNCELQIAGSGDGRLNVHSMRDPINKKNQRFLIYIIPKNIMHDE